MAETEAGEFYKAYEDYSKTLRTWLVAYGIGGPVLMLTNDRVSVVILQSGHGRSIAALFLAGVVIQVVLTAVNKAAMWICYYSYDGDADGTDPWWCNIAHWISKQFWLDLLADVASFGAFALATWYAFDVLVKA